MKVIGLSGWSGAGKTTLLTRLIPHLIAEGLRVSTMKHAHSNLMSIFRARIRGSIGRQVQPKC